MHAKPSNKPAIAVAGHLVYDEIVFPDGSSTSAFGGISYNLAALCAIMRDGRLIPVCEIGSDKRRVFDRAFETCAVLDKSLISETTLPNVVNRLVYDREGRRKEWNSRKPEPLSLERIPGSIDALLMNFISGDDVTPGDLRLFRNRFEGIIYIDFHSLALGRLPNGGRDYRYNPSWRDYVSPADILQLNMAELSTITGERYCDPEAIASACKIIHECGPANIIVTMGRGGIIVSVESGSHAHLIPSLKISSEVDSTGCGDTVAAITLYRYLGSMDIIDSVIEASRWAAAKASFTGLEGFKWIENILENIGPSPKPMKIQTIS